MPPKMPKENVKPAHAWKTMLRILSYFRPYRVKLLVVFLCIIINSVAGVVGLLFIEPLVDDYIVPLMDVENPDLTGMIEVICLMAGIFLAGVLAYVVYTQLMVVIPQKIMMTIREEMFSKMQLLPVRFFDTHSFGDVMSCYTNDTDTLREMIGESVPNVLSSLITLVAVFIAMLSLSVPMTILVVFIAFLMLYLTKKVGGEMSTSFGRQQKSLGAMNGYIEEMVSGMEVVQVFTREKQVLKKFSVSNRELYTYSTKANSYGNIFISVMSNIGNLQYVLIAVVGGFLALYGGWVSLGEIAGFLMLSRSFSQPVSQISQQINSVVMALAGAERIFAIMDEAPETDTGSVRQVHVTEVNGELVESVGETNLWAWKREIDGVVTYSKMEGDIVFDGVSFSYVEGKPVLHDISIHAKPGQKIAIVGSTGSGKSTIMNLINRFYDVDKGKIFYDGIDVADIQKSDLRYSLGIVFQEVNLFTGTILENIKYGRPGATDEEVYAAARLVNADEFIRNLPDGYETVIAGDASILSQGQRQLISIARTALANPPVMILDEATSNIDTRTESIVQEGMESLMRGRTVFVIAHRLSTIQDADQILVLDAGRIIEQGNHADLMELGEKYYQLYTTAFEQK